MIQGLPELRALNQRKAELQAQADQNQAIVQGLKSLDSNNVQAISTLVRFLQGHTSKTEVVNQLKEIGTPDALKVMSAVNDMHSTLKKLKNTDIQPLVAVMSQMLEEVQKIPKENAEAPESVEINNLPDFDSYTKRVEDAIKSIDTKPVVNLPAPQVKIDAPNVTVKAPDFATLEKSIKEIVTAVKNQVFPETKVDTSSIVSEQKKSNELLKKIVEKPMGGGGSGGHTTPYQDADGRPSYVELTVDGKIPVEAGATSNYESRNDTTTDTNLVYLGKALPGSATSDAAWQIKRYNKSAGTMTFADDVTTFTKIWDSRTGYTY